MTRYTFGGTLYDVAVSEDATNVGTETTPRKALALAPSATVALYDAPGGTLQTDFLLWDGAAYTIAATSIVTGSDGFIPAFKGPDGKTVLYDAAGHALPARDAVTGGTTLPTGTAGQFVGYDGSGNPIATTPPAATWGALSGAPTISAFAETLLDDADQGAARTTLGAASASVTVNKTGDQTINGVKDFVDGVTLPDGSLSADVLSDLYAVLDDWAASRSLLHVEAYVAGDTPPDFTGRLGAWGAIETDILAADPELNPLASSPPGSATDGTSWSGTISRSVASGAYLIAAVQLTTTGSAAVAPNVPTLGGVAMVQETDASGNPLRGTSTDGKYGWGIFSTAVSPSGTSFAVTASATMQEATWKLIEVVARDLPTRAAVGASVVSLTPSVSLAGQNPLSRTIGILFQNTDTDPTFDTGTLAEVGVLAMGDASAPTGSIKMVTGAGAGPVSNIGFTSTSGARKTPVIVELPAPSA